MDRSVNRVHLSRGIDLNFSHRKLKTNERTNKQNRYLLFFSWRGEEGRLAASEPPARSDRRCFETTRALVLPNPPLSGPSVAVVRVSATPGWRRRLKEPQVPSFGQPRRVGAGRRLLGQMSPRRDAPSFCLRCKAEGDAGLRRCFWSPVVEEKSVRCLVLEVFVLLGVSISGLIPVLGRTALFCRSVRKLNFLADLVTQTLFCNHRFYSRKSLHYCGFSFAFIPRSSLLRG